MNISNYQHEQNRKNQLKLQEQGFEFEVSADGYFVKCKGQGLGGASVRLPREKPLHYKHRDANIRDNLAAAISLAQKHGGRI